MSEFEVWIYRGLIVILLIICWYFAKQVLVQLKEMNLQLKLMTEKGIVHDGKFELVQTTVSDHRNRLNDHSRKLQELKSTQDRCKHCRETL